ncbi:alpha/beta fold hydrolase [Streptomyces sp. NBC_00233]|uniref:alpha/beta fold hydrolase n=1 Tax=Streptomyces sp. NBC_00233 TaxID=2975686 RepID=UPI002256954F|nr:alpha/beta hydrolase [Streptomyces sp. NBC_00233]MCX5227379.1 alpha/beta fold hydrolase [Streptomyces sp. NBC_00233]
MRGTEHVVQTNGVELYAEAFGDPGDTPLLLIHGAGHSMLAWDEEFVRRLAAGGRYVIRYDSRDAGRSTGYPAGEPPYDLRDLVTDAAGLLDALRLPSAEIVGMSQGAAVAQLLALDHPDRVATLALASSTPGGPGHDQSDLPPITQALLAVFAEDAPVPDWNDRAAVVDWLVEGERPFAASSRPFDTDAMRAWAARVVDHARDIAAQVTNPFLIGAGAPWRDRLGAITAPTLVLHGTEDPLFPLEHGRALASEIPGARFLAMERTGHEVFPHELWNEVVPALLGRAESRRR